MKPALGVELGVDRIRAVRSGRGREAAAQVFEVSWDPEQPVDGTTALRAALGAGGRLAVAVDLTLLYAKHVQLPPVPIAERRRMLALEPERYFPVRGQDLLVAVTDEDVAFAIPELRATAWIAALQAIGPVLRFEPAPMACARALARGGIGDAWVLRNGGAVGAELVEIRDGRVRQARLVYGGAEAARAALPGEPAAPILDFATSGSVLPPSLGPLAPAFLAAYGAGLQIERGSSASLLPATLEAGLERRRRADRAIAVAASLVALGFAVLSFDAARARGLRHLDTRLAAARAQAAPALGLQARVDGLTSEARAVASLEATRPDPLRALQELTALLPHDAFLRSVRGSGAEWQIDGYAVHAATLVPLIENAPHFEQARFLGATSRVQVEGKTYESFSLAFRVVRAP